MKEPIMTRLKNAWSVFTNKDPTPHDNGTGYFYRPDRLRLTGGNGRSIITSIYNRIALDVASVDIRHVRLDEDGEFLCNINSGLNKCFSLEANIDQNSRDFKQDIVMSLLDEGCIAIVPTITTDDPNYTDHYDICALRTGKILEWRPTKIRVRVYNDKTGRKEDIWVAKRIVGIVENPLYPIVNEPNSAMQRLIRKLNLLDSIDEQSVSNKFDLIFQLPYSLKTDVQRKRADMRVQDIENQLTRSKYGIGFIDATEKVVQLNRGIENKLMPQIEYLTNMVYGQLGITQGILDGTANDQTMLNYFNRTIEAILTAIVLELKRKFLSKTARSQNQSIEFFQDPFKFVSASNLAEISDKFKRNEILSSNEIRQIIGFRASDDPKADELNNSNIRGPEESEAMSPMGFDESEEAIPNEYETGLEGGEFQNEQL